MFPKLTTSRLILRKILSEDKQKIFEGLSNDKVIEFYGISFKKLEDVQIQMDWFEDLIKNKTGIWWGITLKGSTEIIGACGFNDWQKEHKKIEIGAWLLPEYWGKGIIGEAINKISEYAFNIMDVHRIEGIVDSNNVKCKKMLKKLDFIYEGTLKDAEIKAGKYISLDYYSKIKQPKIIPAEEKDIQSIKSCIPKYLKEVVIYVYQNKYGEIEGFIGIDKNKIEMLFIHSKSRGKGIGKQLANFAIMNLNSTKLDVNEQNPQAVEFYKHIGFKVIGRSELDGMGNPFPLLHMKFVKNFK